MCYPSPFRCVLCMAANCQVARIQIKVGTSKPEPHPTMKNEWIIYVTPTKLEENWQLFRIDLIDEFKRTFGTEGKSFEGLIGFRVRGNLDLAYISVFES
jgi:hypothetical protein